jgi:hypothetical protein
MTNQLTCRNGEIGKLTSRDVTFNKELYVFLGTIIYMGVHTEPQIEIYWNSDFNKGPLHSITSHISRIRF